MLLLLLTSVDKEGYRISLWQTYHDKQGRVGSLKSANTNRSMAWSRRPERIWRIHSIRSMAVMNDDIGLRP